MSICNFRQKDTKRYDIVVRNADDDIIDISTATIISFVMKRSASLSDVAGLPGVLGPVTATITDGPAGEATIVLNSTDTAQLEAAKYYYEFRIQYTGTTPNTFGTLDFGTVQVLQDLSL